ncbi:MAG: NAD(P)/FAD-dependent oxidoreductase, partial [Eubacteriales bacterium]|nr:NAD(P)/FAD-dependent oxidoreductase [Eubacteriales bacterium]
IMPFSGGLKRNLVQCLDDYGIPLKLSHTVVNIEGKERVTGVTVAAVDEKLHPVPGTEEHYACDTLLLSVGLIPENELSRGMGVRLNSATNGPMVNESLETSIPGVFAAGNVLHVHDLVDYVSEEAAAAGKNAARYVAGLKESARREVPIRAENGVRYTVPYTIDPEQMEETLTVRFRVDREYRDRCVCVYFDGERLIRRKRPILTPGEMEEAVLQKRWFLERPALSGVTVTVEEA